MGLAITVTEKPSRRPGVVRFELNRGLTGMGHERYVRTIEVTGDRPPDELARRLFALAGVNAIHVYANEVTVELDGSADRAAIAEAIRTLFVHYTPGVTPSYP